MELYNNINNSPPERLTFRVLKDERFKAGVTTTCLGIFLNASVVISYRSLFSQGSASLSFQVLI